MTRPFLRVVDSWEEILCVLLIAVSVAVGFIGVFWRYVLSDPFIWTEEVLRLLLVWLTFIGMSMAVKKKGHLRLDLVDGFVRGKPKTVLDAANSLLVLLFAVVLMFTSWEMVQDNWSISLVASGLPAGLFYLPIVLGTASITARVLIGLIVLALGAANGKTSTETA